MSTWHIRLRNVAIACTAGIGLWAVACNKPSTTEKTQVETNPKGDVTQGSTDAGQTTGPTPTANVNYDQGFEEAAITEVLEGLQFPPDITIGGMKTGPLRLAIENSWPKIKLKDSAGKVVPYVLHLETDEGIIEIKLRPEIAPNHVRNLLSLARAGFYNGLKFERNIHQESELENVKVRLDMLIAGCPAGTGDDGIGHIGYFIRGETQQDLKHEEGTVGIWHEEDPDSAGTRFYITLGPAAALDGKFTIVGSVSQGIEVVRKIASQPRMSSDTAPENEKPVNPVGIKRAAVIPDPMGS